MFEGLVLDKGCKPWKLRLGFLSIYRLLVASILLALAGLTLLASRADRRQRPSDVSTGLQRAT